MGSALSFTCTENGKRQIQLEEFLKIENEIKNKTILMDKKLRETTYLCVEIMNSKRRKGETWSRGTNSRLPFDVNVMLNLSWILFPSSPNEEQCWLHNNYLLINYCNKGGT